MDGYKNWVPLKKLVVQNSIRNKKVVLLTDIWLLILNFFKLKSINKLKESIYIVKHWKLS
jgi:hypothetical protein